MTVAAAAEFTLTPLRKRWGKWVQRAGPKTMRRLQWGYLLLSLGLLWGLLGYTETHRGGQWISQVVLSVLYLAVLLLLAALLMPREVWLRLAHGFSRITKLAVVVNYLTMLLLLQNLIGAWMARASILAGLFVVSWVGAWLLCCCLWPMYITTANILLGGVGGFDASDPQGRTVRND